MLKIDREETVNLEDAVDALNLQERRDELYERYMFPGNNVDRGDSLATLINNHSILIKSKDHKPTEDLLRDMKIVEDTDSSNIRASAMDEEKINRTDMKKREQASKVKDLEVTYKSKFDPSKQQELESMWSEFVSERKRKLDRKLC